MNPHTRRLTVLLFALVVVGACATDHSPSARLLDERLRTTLAPDIAANRVTLQRLPDGARVTLLDPSLFANGPPPPDVAGVDPSASVIEGLLDPDLMRIQMTDTSALPEDQRSARVRNATRYFSDYGLGSTLRPAGLSPPPEPLPPGLTITIGVACPDPHEHAGYDGGKRKPGCF